jgi:hypothetical protein
LQLGTLVGPKGAAIVAREIAVEVEPPGEEFAFVGVVEGAWVAGLAGVVLGGRCGGDCLIEVDD